MAEFVLGLLIGSIIGAVLIARWWLRQIDKPKFAAEYLRQVYCTAHAHWLQPSPTDDTLCCPVCGWSEERGRRARETGSADPD